MSKLKLVLILILLVCAARGAYAQSCSEEFAIKARLDAQTDQERLAFINHWEESKYFGELLAWTAVAGPSMIPTLREMAVPGKNIKYFPDEAQIALAKLGDATALAKIEQEWNTSKNRDNALSKLLAVGNDRAVALLMEFLKEHISDQFLYHDWGDYATDVRDSIKNGLYAIVISPPTVPGERTWIDWWEQNKGRPVTLSTLAMSAQLSDPYLACLVRKVEWIPIQALHDIQDIGNYGNQAAIPFLRVLEHTGELVYTMNGIRGRAEVALAKLGDEEAFRTLERYAYEGGAINQLAAVRGKRAATALVAALDSDFPKAWLALNPPDQKNKRIYAGYRKRRAQYKKETDTGILDILNHLLVNPPHLTGSLEHQKDQFKQWWATNKDTAQFVIPSPKTYE